ncbi:hypothetical protein MCOR25_008484 [Pyricularia grisea]|nr:hypothetical protein MCOR25_008484 [Pyricularia grisea]
MGKEIKMSKKHATDFEKIIHADRNRKQKEALAARIFSRDRRSSAPGKGSGLSSPSAAAGSLASRVGVKKNRASSGAVKPGDVNGIWFHDLHGSSTDAAKPAAGSLASRISTPGGGPAVPKGPKRQQQQQQQQQQQRASKLSHALSRDQAKAPAQQQATVRNSGISIRGLAGPPVVMAQNFAPGTTAADIESAFTPCGGIVTSCRLLKTSPIIIAEIVFEDPNGAQRVIDQFNNQMADGRLLRVYPKVGGGAVTQPIVSRPEPLLNGSGNIIDGSHGFSGGDYDTGMDVDGGGGSERKLYSDSLLPRNGNGGRGGSRGNNRGRGKGSGR